MKAYATDLRERMVAACGETGVRIYQLAARFWVSGAFVDQLLRHQRTMGFARRPTRVRRPRTTAGPSGAGRIRSSARASAPTQPRLRQVDRDGTFSYSPVRAVTFGDKPNDRTLAPAPIQTTTRPRPGPAWRCCPPAYHQACTWYAAGARTVRLVVG